MTNLELVDIVVWVVFVVVLLVVEILMVRYAMMHPDRARNSNWWEV